MATRNRNNEDYLPNRPRPRRRKEDENETDLGSMFKGRRNTTTHTSSSGVTHGGSNGRAIPNEHGGGSGRSMPGGSAHTSSSGVTHGGSKSRSTKGAKLPEKVIDDAMQSVKKERDKRLDNTIGVIDWLLDKAGDLGNLLLEGVANNAEAEERENLRQIESVNAMLPEDKQIDTSPYDELLGEKPGDYAAELTPKLQGIGKGIGNVAVAGVVEPYANMMKGARSLPNQLVHLGSLIGGVDKDTEAGISDIVRNWTHEGLQGEIFDELEKTGTRLGEWSNEWVEKSYDAEVPEEAEKFMNFARSVVRNTAGNFSRAQDPGIQIAYYLGTYLSGGNESVGAAAAKAYSIFTMYLSASQAGKERAMARGLDEDEAEVVGMLSGMNEGIQEYFFDVVGLPKIKAKGGLDEWLTDYVARNISSETGQLVAHYVGAIISEDLQEMLGNLIDLGIDYYAFGDTKTGREFLSDMGTTMLETTISTLLLCGFNGEYSAEGQARILQGYAEALENIPEDQRPAVKKVVAQEVAKITGDDPQNIEWYVDVQLGTVNHTSEEDIQRMAELEAPTPEEQAILDVNEEQKASQQRAIDAAVQDAGVQSVPGVVDFQVTTQPQDTAEAQAVMDRQAQTTDALKQAMLDNAAQQAQRDNEVLPAEAEGQNGQFVAQEQELGQAQQGEQGETVYQYEDENGNAVDVHRYTGRLNKSQSDTLVLASELGRNAIYVDALPGDNVGMYDAKTNRIYLSAKHSRKASMWLFFHELTHDIAEGSGRNKVWNEFLDYAYNAAMAYRGNWNSYIKGLRDDYAKFYKKDSASFNDKVREEVAAEFVQQYLFRREDAVRALKQRNGRWYQRVWRELKDFVDTSIGAKDATLVKAEQLFSKVYAESLDNLKKNDPMSEQQEAWFSRKMDDDMSEAADKVNRKDGKVSSDVLRTAIMQRAWVKTLMDREDIAAVLPADDTTTNGKFNTKFGNNSYGWSEENSTICVRQICNDIVCDIVAERIGRPLNVLESLWVSQKFMGYADKGACLYCYELMDRWAKSEYTNKYLEQRDAVIERLRNGEDRDAVWNDYIGSKKPTDKQKDRFAMWERIASGEISRAISPADVASQRTIDQTLKSHPELADQISDCIYYAQSSSQAKKKVKYTAYDGHILNWTEDFINQLNSSFGMRMYSFSDFSPAFILENMQMITDAAVRGLKGLAYTKETDYVKIFAPTGQNINMSVFGYTNERGEVVEDAMQGARWEEVKAMREKYPNVGAVFVATSDAQVEWALAQDWIDVVIPFHTVRSGKTVADALGYKIFTGQQRDRKASGWTEGVDLKEIPPALHNNDKQLYLDLLQQNHLTPRFADWLDNPNYMKLVNETRMAYSETKALQPIFDTSEVQDMLERFVAKGGYENEAYGSTHFPLSKAAQRIADDFERNINDIEQQVRRSPELKRVVDEYDSKEEESDQYFARSVTPEMAAEYQTAYEEGDEETAQRLVDEAAEAAGYDTSQKLYHGTNAEFNSFRVGSGQYGDGVYFTYDKGEADGYGDRIISVYAKPLKIANYEDLANLLGIENLRDYWDGIDSTGNFEDDLTDFDYHPESQDILMNAGYDGFVDEGNGGIVIYPENGWGDIGDKVKSADPFTFDDDGNLIPLQKRFEPANNDIRFARSTEQDDEESFIYLNNGKMSDTGEEVNFADLILDGKKTGETRPRRTLSVGKWTGLAAKNNGKWEVVGRVKFGSPKEITKESPEYESAMIKGTDYDIPDGESKWFYPVVDKEDFRDNPREVSRHGQTGKYKPGDVRFARGQRYENYDAIPEEVRNDPRWGFHAGDLGKAEGRAGQGYGRGTGHFGTGTYFVGKDGLHYLEDDYSYKKRPIETVDLDAYDNLWKPRNKEEGITVHEFLKGVDGRLDTTKAADRMAIYDAKRHIDDVLSRISEGETVDLQEYENLMAELREALGRDFGNVVFAIEDAYRNYGDKAIQHNDAEGFYRWNGELGDIERMSDGEALQAIGWDKLYDLMRNLDSDLNWTRRLKDWKMLKSRAAHALGVSVEKLNAALEKAEGKTPANYEESKTADSRATNFMKALGFNGVDVRGIKGLDDTEFGSVVYDLKGNDLERKQANNPRFARILSRSMAKIVGEDGWESLPIANDYLNYLTDSFELLTQSNLQSDYAREDITDPYALYDALNNYIIDRVMEDENYKLPENLSALRDDIALLEKAWDYAEDEEEFYAMMGGDTVKTGQAHKNQDLLGNHLTTKNLSSRFNKITGSLQRSRSIEQLDEQIGEYFEKYGDSLDDKTINSLLDLWNDVADLYAIDQDYRGYYEKGNDEAAAQVIKDVAATNGYTRKVYSGTDTFGFTVIDPDPKYGGDGESFWATSRPDVAETYTSGERRTIHSAANESDITWDDVVGNEGLVDTFVNEVMAAFPEIDDDTLGQAIEGANLYDAAQYAYDYNEAYEAYWDFLQTLLSTSDQKYTEYIKKYGDMVGVNRWLSENTVGKRVAAALDDVVDAVERLTEDKEGGIYELYANPDNLFEFDGRDSWWSKLTPTDEMIATTPSDMRAVYSNRPLANEHYWKTRDVLQWAKANGYSGVHFKNIQDDGGQGVSNASSDVYAFLHPQQQVKSADTYTFDDDGNLILPSERFNDYSLDLRFARTNNDDFTEEESEDDIRHRKLMKDTFNEMADSFDGKRGDFQRTSRVGSHTLARTPLHTRAEKNMMGVLDMDSLRKYYGYEPKGEIESLHKARERVSTEEKRRQEERSLPHKFWDGEDTDTAMMILSQKLEEARESGDFKAVRKWAKMIQRRGTEAGQRIQAFAKYTATPEGMLVKCGRVLEESTKYWQEKHPKQTELVKRLALELTNGFENIDSKEWKFNEKFDVKSSEAYRRIYDVVKRLGRANGIKISNPADAAAQIAELVMKEKGDERREQILDSLMTLSANGYIGLTDEEMTQVYDLFEQAEQYAPTSKQAFELESQAYQIFANHINSSWSDKWNAWRYLAMLGNTRTHIKNILGNIMFGEVVAMKDSLAGIIEQVSGVENRTKTANLAWRSTARGKALYKAAVDDADYIYTILRGKSKYNVEQSIEGQKRIFKNNLLEKLRKANDFALEAEDWWALKRAYARSLANYMYTNHLTAADLKNDTNEVNKARANAVKEAQKATFRNANAVAQALSNFSDNLNNADNAGVRLLGKTVEGVVPFKNTPANIVARGIEYSPAGVISTVSKAIDHQKTGFTTGAEVADSLASTLVGTGIVALGAFLASAGLLTGGDDDDDRVQKWRDAIGKQSYAFQIGDHSYTLDWAAPAAMPLMVGAELYKSLEGKGFDLNGILTALSSAANPAVEMTMLQGVKNIIDSASYGDNSLASLAWEAGTSYLTQAVPTLSGQLARSVDDTRRTSASDSTGFKGDLEYLWNRQKTKTPFLSKTVQPYIDVWGREQKNEGGNFLGRLAYNALSPGYYSKTEMTDADRFVESVYNATGDSKALPQKPSRTVNKVRLDGETYTEYARIMGQTSLDMVTELSKQTGLDNTQNLALLQSIYQYANYKAQVAVGIDNESAKKAVEKYAALEAQGVRPFDYMFWDIKYGNGNGSMTQEEVYGSGLTEEEKRMLWEASGWKTDYDKYKPKN